ncbi:MAG: type II/IV secretion system protein [Deltaproteobacteria bacterium]|nr:type II/IV secretion system protein [Deltaproteobacteria bacterium]
MPARHDRSAIEPVIPRESDLTLVKLLIKLDLLKPPFLQQKHIFSEFAPIAHFGHLGIFDEGEAIGKVAAHLKTERFEPSDGDQDRIAKLLESEPFSEIPLIIWRRCRAIPVAVSSSEVTVAIANPLDLESIRSLEQSLNRRVRAVVGRETEIIALISRTVELKDALDFNEFLQESAQSTASPTGPSGPESSITAEDISAPTVVRLVNKIFAGAILKGASDLHVTPEQKVVRVRIRIDGIMRDLMEVPAGYSTAVVSRIKVLCGMDITERRHPQDGRLRLKTSQGVRDLRVSTVPTIHGENLVARILATDFSRLDLDALGMQPVLLERFKKVLRSSSQIHLICGPTGSGKTSTLYAALMHLKDGTQNIVTIEDPIENRVSGITQIQVSEKIGLTFPKALRSVLRQDPDVIMVGEIRDADTAATAVQVAQTGHVVISTIHTNTAAGAVTRLRDLGVPSFMIASSLGSVLAQRLVRKLCKNCKGEAEPAERERLRRLLIPEQNAHGPVGCEICDYTGYRGRVGIFSYLEIGPELSAAIREEKGERVIEALALEQGFISLGESAAEIIASGTTSLSEVERVMGQLDTSAKGTLQNGAVAVQGEGQTGAICKRRILVADDDENVRMVYKLLLEQHMYEVEEATNGFEALEAIYRRPPSLLVLDLMMPKMNGLEALERLRQDPQTRNIPVLMLTAAATDENELNLLKHGADDFVSKTANSDIILARINRLLSSC